MEFITAHLTDQGLYREKNQDALSLQIIRAGRRRILLAVVCDGLGGLSDGELASARVVQSVTQWFRQHWQELAAGRYAGKRLQKELTAFMEQEHKKLSSHGRRRGRMLGTTVSLLLVLGRRFYIMHVGDTRIYLIRRRVRQLSADHALSENVLLQCVGSARKIKPDFTSGRVKRGVGFLLCSDGFYRRLARGELEQGLARRHTYSSSEAGQRLLELCRIARMRGEEDNISAIFVKVK